MRPRTLILVEEAIGRVGSIDILVLPTLRTFLVLRATQAKSD